MIVRLARRLGVNYFWGLANFTFGVAAGGIYVAVILIAHGILR
jgi:hypothetical protein